MRHIKDNELRSWVRMATEGFDTADSGMKTRFLQLGRKIANELALQLNVGTEKSIHFSTGGPAIAGEVWLRTNGLAIMLSDSSCGVLYRGCDKLTDSSCGANHNNQWMPARDLLTLIDTNGAAVNRLRRARDEVRTAPRTDITRPTNRVPHGHPHTSW